MLIIRRPDAASQFPRRDVVPEKSEAQEKSNLIPVLRVIKISVLSANFRWFFYNSILEIVIKNNGIGDWAMIHFYF
jgi:hypothetical protein